VNTYIRLSKREVEEAVQEAHPYFQEQSEEEPEEQVPELLRGLTPEAQRNVEMVRKGSPFAEMEE